MYADAVAKIADSIFPIFYIAGNDTEFRMGVCGTGFFIDDSGLFLTAEHVMTISALPDSTLYYYGRVPDELCEPAVEIEHVASDPGRDLYLGRVPQRCIPPVALSDEAVRPGDAVCLSGYPMAVLATNLAHGSMVGNIRRYWQPSFVIDATQALIDHRLYDGYIVQDACLPGMSGGPVFDTAGKVRGMSMATLRRTIPDPTGPPVVVSNGIVIDVDHIRDFLANAAHRYPNAAQGTSCAAVTSA